METITMNYPVTLHIEEESQCTKVYAFDVPETTVSTGSRGTAVKQMKTRVSEAITRALKDSELDMSRKRLVVTNAGDVLIVRYMGWDCWGYDIASNRRDYASSNMGRKTFDESLTDARRHAESSFGGIAWESRF